MKNLLPLMMLVALITFFSSCNQDDLLGDFEAMETLDNSVAAKANIDESNVIGADQIDENAVIEEEIESRNGWVKLYEKTIELHHNKWFGAYIEKDHLDPHCTYFVIVTPYHGNPDAYVHGKDQYGNYRMIRKSTNTHGYDESYGKSADLHQDEHRMYFHAYAKTASKFKIEIFKFCEGQGGDAPIITFKKPMQDSICKGEDLYVKVDAHDNDGIKYVKLYVNGYFVRQENNAPYEWGKPHTNNDHQLNNLQAGTYELKAVAEDHHGNKTTKKYYIVVKDCHYNNDAPTVTFKNIHDGAKYPKYTDLYVKVDAYDADGIEYVDLYVNGYHVRKESYAPYEWGKPYTNNDHQLNHMLPGTYKIKAVAKDRYGKKTEKTVTIVIKH